MKGKDLSEALIIESMGFHTHVYTTNVQPSIFVKCVGKYCCEIERRAMLDATYSLY